jgi:hypothetical protein
MLHPHRSEERVEVLVQVGDVGGPGARLDVLVRQPLLLDVLPERDPAHGGVVPGAREDLLLFAVRRLQRLASGGVGAG